MIGLNVTTHWKAAGVAFFVGASIAHTVLLERATAQVHLVATDDASTSNDTARGPTATNDRSDFVEIRNHPATRKRIGYFKYNISAIDPLLFPFARLSGSFADGRDGNGSWNIYGLNDGETNTDDVPDGSFGEANWTEGALTYAMGLGVDVTVSPATVGDLGLDLTEISLLGSITLVDGEPFLSNTTDLPLASFLSADTNGVVTFMIADLTSETEWRVVAREASGENSVRLSFFPLAGDTDLDGIVELEDLDPIRANHRRQNVTYADGDLNGNNIVDFPDFRIWKTAILNAGVGSLAGVDLGFLSVPEPAAITIAAAGIVGVGALVYRRRKSRTDAECGTGCVSGRR